MKDNKTLIGTAVALVVVAAGVTVAFGPWTGNDAASAAEAAPRAAPAQDQPQDPMLAARTKGPADAPLTLYEVADFQCSACRIFFKETLPLLEEEYIASGKLRMVFINFPIPQLHPNAAAAHEFALCAAEQDRFWPVHDLLFEYQTDWGGLADPSDFFFGLADSASLAADSLGACLQSGRMQALVMSEARSAYNSGVQSTPSFVIEGGLVRGAAPIDAWRPLLDSVYLAKREERE